MESSSALLSKRRGRGSNRSPNRSQFFGDSSIYSQNGETTVNDSSQYHQSSTSRTGSPSRSSSSLQHMNNRLYSGGNNSSAGNDYGSGSYSKSSNQYYNNSSYNETTSNRNYSKRELSANGQRAMSSSRSNYSSSRRGGGGGGNSSNYDSYSNSSNRANYSSNRSNENKSSSYGNSNSNNNRSYRRYNGGDNYQSNSSYSNNNNNNNGHRSYRRYNNDNYQSSSSSSTRTNNYSNRSGDYGSNSSERYSGASGYSGSKPFYNYNSSNESARNNQTNVNSFAYSFAYEQGISSQKSGTSRNDQDRSGNDFYQVDKDRAAEAVDSEDKRSLKVEQALEEAKNETVKVSEAASSKEADSSATGFQADYAELNRSMSSTCLGEPKVGKSSDQANSKAPEKKSAKPPIRKDQKTNRGREEKAEKAGASYSPSISESPSLTLSSASSFDLSHSRSKSYSPNLSNVSSKMSPTSSFDSNFSSSVSLDSAENLDAKALPTSKSKGHEQPRQSGSTKKQPADEDKRRESRRLQESARNSSETRVKSLTSQERADLKAKKRAKEQTNSQVKRRKLDEEQCDSVQLQEASKKAKSSLKYIILVDFQSLFYKWFDRSSSSRISINENLSKAKVLHSNENLGDHGGHEKSFHLKLSSSTDPSQPCSDCEIESRKELEQLSEILPVISYKLTNFNLAKYINDMEKKSALMVDYSTKIDKCVEHYEAQSKSSMDAANDFESDSALDLGLELNEENFDSENLSTIESPKVVKPSPPPVQDHTEILSKLNLIKRILSECSSRLEIQLSYMRELDALFTSLKAIAQQKENAFEVLKWAKTSRTQLATSQSLLIDHARKNRLNELTNMLQGFSFNFLIDILNRFLSTYDLDNIVH